MKALRYLLIVIAMVSFLGVNAQGLAQRPEIKMQSTSGMVYSGSTLPSAAADGTVLTGATVGTYTPASTSGPRRIGGGNSGGGSGPANPDDPYATPIGDAALPLMMLAAAYALLRAWRKRRV